MKNSNTVKKQNRKQLQSYQLELPINTFFDDEWCYTPMAVLTATTNQLFLSISGNWISSNPEYDTKEIRKAFIESCNREYATSLKFQTLESCGKSFLFCLGYCD